MGGEAEAGGVAGICFGDGDAVLGPETVVNGGEILVGEVDFNDGSGDGGVAAAFEGDARDGGETGAEAGGEGEGAGLDLGHAGSGEEVDGFFEAAEFGIVALAEGFELPGAGGLVGPVIDAEDGGGEFGEAGGADVEHATFERAHGPFVKAAGEGIDFEVGEVEVHPAEGLGTVDVAPCVGLVGKAGDGGNGVEEAGGVREVGDSDDAGPGGDLFLEGGEEFVGGFGVDGDVGDDDGGSGLLGAELPALGIGGVVVGGDEDFLAGLEAETLGDEVVAFAGVAGEGDFVGGGAEKIGEFGADGFGERFVDFAVLEGGIFLEVGELFEVLGEGDLAAGGDVGRVHVDEALLQGHERSDGGGRHLGIDDGRRQDGTPGKGHGISLRIRERRFCRRWRVAGPTQRICRAVRR